MQAGKFNCIVDSAHGSSAKGAASTRLVDIYKVPNVSSCNFPNAGHCQTFDTYIITNEGLELLGDVVEKGSARSAVSMLGGFEEIGAFVPDGKRKINEIVLINGMSFKCTDEHKYYVWDSLNGHRAWIRSIDLNPDIHQFLALKTIHFPNNSLFKTNFTDTAKANKTCIMQPTDEVAFAKFLGLLVGDGYYAGKTKIDIAFNTQQTDTLGFVVSMLASMGITNLPTYKVADKECVVLSITQVAGLKDMLEFVGLHTATKDKKTTPANVLTSNKAVMAGYLSGLFDADGSAKTDRVTLSNCARSVVYDAQQILYVLGIHSAVTVYMDKPGRSGSNRLPQYTLSISGKDNLAVFRDTIGFMSKYKNDRLAECIESTESQGQIVRLSPVLKDAVNKHRKSRRTNTRTAYVAKLPDLQELTELKTTCRVYHIIDIKSVEREIGEEEVYDLTMPGSHSYVANGFISHNTAVKGEVKFISKALPTPAFLNILAVHKPKLWIGPQSGFFLDQLQKELIQTRYAINELMLHERAVVVDNRHIVMESPGGSQSTEWISSTMSGSGAAYSEKAMRRREVETAKNSKRFDTLAPMDFMEAVRNEMQAGRGFMHEVSQGFALSINHGTHYPTCLNAAATVEMADGTLVPIKTLVRDRSTALVVSLDAFGRKEARPITGWIEKSIGTNKWLQIITTTSRVNKDGVFYGPRFTNDHEVLTTRGLVRVDHLTSEDRILNGETQFDSVGLQMFLGSMLGDGCVYKSTRRSSRTKMAITHGPKQHGYAKYKAAILSMTQGGHTRDITTKGGFKPGSNHIRYESASSVYLAELAESYGCLGHKNINVDKIMTDIDALGLAVWYMDDGQYKKHSTGDEVYLHTEGFSSQQVADIISWLGKKFDVLATTYNTSLGQPYIRISRKSHTRWFKLVGQHIHPDLLYKLPAKYMVKHTESQPSDGVAYSEAVIRVIENAPTRYKSMVYCIEVDVNHNFFVGHVDGRFAVKNCTFRDCTSQQAWADFCITPQYIGDVYLNVRSFPIRVGSNFRDGQQVGYSGDFCDDQQETTWEQVAKDAGMPPAEAAALAEKERTTVTKKIRRVATQSWMLLEQSARATGATKLILNFPQYIDWTIWKMRGGRECIERMPAKVRAYVEQMENVTGLPVCMIGTSAEHDDYIWLE